MADIVFSLPLSRLIITGRDTPENLRLLFGPRCLRTLNFHQDYRLTQLLDPPPGSPWHDYENHFRDASLVRSLRPADEAEKQMMGQVREMQAMIRQRFAARSPSLADMQAIVKSFGNAWKEGVRVYIMALNTMDQNF